jgi:hypothetical protein
VDEFLHVHHPFIQYLAQESSFGKDARPDQHCEKNHVFSSIFSLYCEHENPDHSIQSVPVAKPNREPSLKLEAWAAGLVCLALLANMPFLDRDSQAQQNKGTQASPSPHDSSQWSNITALAIQTAYPSRNPDDARISPERQKQLTALNLEHRKEMTADTEKLLALANQLKAGMDKSGDEMLSLDGLLKAEQIEKLARKVCEKMKASVAN